MQNRQTDGKYSGKVKVYEILIISLKLSIGNFIKSKKKLWIQKIIKKKFPKLKENISLETGKFFSVLYEI